VCIHVCEITVCTWSKCDPSQHCNIDTRKSSSVLRAHQFRKKGNVESCSSPLVRLLHSTTATTAAATTFNSDSIVIIYYHYCLLLRDDACEAMALGASPLVCAAFSTVAACASRLLMSAGLSLNSQLCGRCAALLAESCCYCFYCLCLCSCC
jgi:hypothetical protein